jgi:archaeal flagellin FlaB
MKLIRKGHRHAHRGVIGIEAAIVLIAFVIVAAALAFVVLNMGFSTTQKAKTAIIAAIEEAGSSMEVAGKMTAAGSVATQELRAVNIPLKIISGGATANLDGNATSIRFISGDVEYDNIYFCGAINGTFNTPTLAWDQAVTDCPTIGTNPITGAPLAATTAIVYWSVNLNNNPILDIAEHAVLSVGFSAADRPTQLDHISFEILPPTGAPLTVDRTVPSVTSNVVDLG